MNMLSFSSFKMPSRTRDFHGNQSFVSSSSKDPDLQKTVCCQCWVESPQQAWSNTGPGLCSRGQPAVSRTRHTEWSPLTFKDIPRSPQKLKIVGHPKTSQDHSRSSFLCCVYTSMDPVDKADPGFNLDLTPLELSWDVFEEWEANNHLHNTTGMFSSGYTHSRLTTRFRDSWGLYGSLDSTDTSSATGHQRTDQWHQSRNVTSFVNFPDQTPSRSVDCIPRRLDIKRPEPSESRSLTNPSQAEDEAFKPLDQVLCHFDTINTEESSEIQNYTKKSLDSVSSDNESRSMCPDSTGQEYNKTVTAMQHLMKHDPTGSRYGNHDDTNDPGLSPQQIEAHSKVVSWLATLPESVTHNSLHPDTLGSSASHKEFLKDRIVSTRQLKSRIISTSQSKHRKAFNSQSQHSSSFTLSKSSSPTTRSLQRSIYNSKNAGNRSQQLTPESSSMPSGSASYKCDITTTSIWTASPDRHHSLCRRLSRFRKQVIRDDTQLEMLAVL